MASSTDATFHSSERKVPQRKYGGENPRLPRSVPIIGLGCSSFSAFFSSHDDLSLDAMSRDHPLVQRWVETIRHAVLHRGINLLDTAPWYGHGTSEIVLGYALDTILMDDEGDQVTNKSINDDYVNQSIDGNTIHSRLKRRTRIGSLSRSDVILNTKIGRYELDPVNQFDFSYVTTINSVLRSLERMNCNYIDVLQLHDPEFAPTLSILMSETIPALIECRKRGWTKAIGLTGYPLEVQHEILVKCSEVFNNEIIFDQSLVYCHNNLHDMSLFQKSCFPSLRKDSTGRNQESSEDISLGSLTSSATSTMTFAQFCEHSKINLMAAAPLSMGLLTMSGPPAWHPAPTSLKEACVHAAIICKENGVDISSLAILFALSQHKISCTILGMKDVEELEKATKLAMRFSSMDFDYKLERPVQEYSEDGIIIEPILEKVLTLDEKKTLDLLLDQKNGPFASVWLNGDACWDGKAEAEKFWSLVHEIQASATSHFE